MTIAGRILRAIGSFVSNLFSEIDDEAKKLIPIAIAFVNAIKAVADNPVDTAIINFVKDALEKEFPDEKDLIDKILTDVETWLPKILDDLKAALTVANITDVNERLKAILALFPTNTENQNTLFYHNFASLVLSEVSDGKFTLNKAFIIVEAWYEHQTEAANAPDNQDVVS